MIKKEIESLRTSISTFVNIAIGGSIIGSLFVFLSRGSTYSYALTVALTLFVAVFLLSVFYILIYKFTAHNRYFGYLNLLSQEIHHEKMEAKDGRKECTVDNFVSYEFCIAKMQAYFNRKFDEEETLDKKFRKEFWSEILKFTFTRNGMPVDAWNNPDNFYLLKQHWHRFRLKQPEADKWRFFKGVRMLAEGLIEEDTGNSWKYPLYVSYAIFLNIFLFVCIAGWYFIQHLKITESSPLISPVLNVYTIVMLFISSTILYKSVGQLYCIMNGSKSINGYCWKFLQFRIQYLNSLGFHPYYNITSINLKVKPPEKQS